MTDTPQTAPSKKIEVEEIEDLEITRYRKLGPFWLTVSFVLTAAATLLAIYQIFNIGASFNFVFVVPTYLYLIGGMMLGLLFIVMPAHANASRTSVPWYDVAMMLFTFGMTAYVVTYGHRIQEEAWEYNAPIEGRWLAVIYWLLILEVSRRAGGLAVFFVVLVCSFYPIFAEYMPAVFQGASQSFLDTAGFHIYSETSMLGIPMQVFAQLVFGFLLFGVALVYTGAGQFFINFAFALLGHVRGGPAKVAIFSSGLFGSMSGGPVTNVLTTGSLTIPAMRRIGIRPKTAGAIEACASTGGVMMPPIMGATAFVMADFLNVRYVDVALAALVPSLLFYFGLFVQIDSYAANNKLTGLPREELPSLWQVFRDGWYYIAVFAFLVWMLVWLQREGQAPFYATALLLVINQFSPKYRLTWAKLRQLVYATGCLLAELVGLLAGIGLIIGSLTVTGMAGTLTNDLVFLAGGNSLLLLIMGAIASFILGMGMTVTAAYIFLAIILAPAVIKAGLDPMAVHMFLLYWGMLSFITPPVALAAFAGASIARAHPMETGFEAMRLGSIIYFIPFFFAFNPALLFRGTPLEIAIVVVTAAVGVWITASALQGYLLGFGRMSGGVLGWLGRFVTGAGGLLLAAPGGGMIGIGHLELTLAAVVVILVGLGLCIVGRRVAGVAVA
ncbi:MAG: TRAP transporter fused permease subunit [Hyphomicrobiaceae bacterium]|nr:TRAP transporter fused permease subunit [Hyphomicrobiaceae bacterium]